MSNEFNQKRRQAATTSSSSSPSASASASASTSLSSAAIGGGDSEMSTRLTSLLECPVCFDYVLPPILQCSSGHLVCNSCRSKLTCCPICRGPMADIRNLAMEKVASNLEFPCKHSGCSASLVCTEKTEHEETCECRPYLCPCPGPSCQWQGPLDLVVQHIMMSHNCITIIEGEEILFQASGFNIPGPVVWVMMQSCFGHHFMFVLKKHEKYVGHQQCFAIMQLIGPRKEAENFVYRIELKGHHRHIAWQATPRSIHEGFASNSHCFIFDTSIVQLFAKNDNLCVSIAISIRLNENVTEN